MTKLETLYCAWNEEDKTYDHFFRSKISVRMCGVGERNIKEVELHEVQEGEPFDFWGWHDMVEEECIFIYKHLEAVKMCSHNSFQTEVAAGTGRFVKLKVVEVGVTV